MTSIPSLEFMWAQNSPGTQPLTVSEVKNYLKIDEIDVDIMSDTLIQSLITAVRLSAEKYLKTSLCHQQWRLVFQDYIPAWVRLPMGPVTKLICVKSYMRDRTETIHPADIYYLNANKTRIHFDANIIANKIEIVYEAGDKNIHESIKDGMKYHIASIYDGLGGANIVPYKCEELYKPFKVISR